MTLRIDAARLRAPERTEEGYVRAEGIIATPGVLAYETKSGETVRELVSAETLKDPEFLSVGVSIIAQKPPRGPPACSPAYY